MGLKQIREAAGLTLAGLAAKTGFGKSTIGNYENGKTAASPEFLKTMAEALNVSEAELTSGNRVELRETGEYRVSAVDSALVQIDQLQAQISQLRKTVQAMKKG